MPITATLEARGPSVRWASPANSGLKGLLLSYLGWLHIASRTPKFDAYRQCVVISSVRYFNPIEDKAWPAGQALAIAGEAKPLSGC